MPRRRTKRKPKIKPLRLSTPLAEGEIIIPEPPPPPTPAEIEAKLIRKKKFKAEDDKYLDKLQNAFIEQLGDIEELKTALAQSETPKIQQFLKDLVSTKHKRWTISAIATKNGVTPAMLSDIWRKYNLSKGMLVLLNGIPEVSEHIVIDAKSTKDVCSRCDGLGKIYGMPESDDKPKPILDCPLCDGKGTVRKAGNSEARKLMFEAAGITNKRGPNVVITNTTVQVESVMDEIDKMMEASTTIIDISPVANNTAIEESSNIED